MTRAKRILVMAASFAALSPVASAYYHWVYFANRNAPFTPISAKFDLTSLPDSQTVSFFISDQGPGPLMPGDSLQAIVSQIQLAANAWNGVASSQVRLAFGGFSSATTQFSSPGVDLVFDDDMPPGLLAQSKPTTVADLSFIANGAPFVPIVRSRMQLRKDLTTYQQASHNDSFFLTIVHEFGHTLGLQHTLTSGVMSTSVTRATTKAQPLSPDDVAGLSLLYPAPGFLAATGSITGTVLQSGAGVNLASVVALTTAGVAISGMTNPDGSYRIDGLPPGQYYVYVHPLPPAQQGEAYPDNVVPPVDSAKNPFPANTGFDTQFFPGTRDWTQASVIGVTAGHSSDGINFSVQKRNGPAVYDMVTYGYQGVGGQVPVQAPSLASGTRTYLVFFAYGTVVNNNQLAPGMTVSVIGGPAQAEGATLQYWSGGYLLMVVDTGTVSSSTPVALAVNVNNDMYVLPAAFTVVPGPPPVISSVTSAQDGQGNATAVIAGSNLGPGLRTLFDGAPASLLGVNPDGSLVVAPPPATGGYQAAVEVLAGDGQSSSQALGSAAPSLFTYNAASTPTISVNPASVSAGTDTMVEIDGNNTNFIDGHTAVGFGSSDIFVRRVWVLSPGRLLVNVSVNGAAPATVSSVTVETGLQLATLTTTLQIQAASPGQISLRTPILNQVTLLDGVPLGGTALINTSGLPQSLSGWTLLIANQSANFSLGPNGVIRASVPGLTATGPAVVQLISPSGASTPPVLIQVDPYPPAITGASNAGGVSIDAAHPVKSGDLVTLEVFGLADSNNVLPAAANIQINVGGVTQVAASIAPDPNQPGDRLIQFTVPSNTPNGSATPVTVGIGTRVSAPYSINIQN